MLRNAAVAPSSLAPRLATSRGIRVAVRPEKTGDAAVVAEVIEQDMYRLTALRDVDVRTVVDVGAHVGSFGLFVKLLWPEARIAAAEPNPRSFQLLQENLGRFGPEVVLEEAAVRYDGADVLTDSHGATGGGFLAHSGEVGGLLQPNGRDRVWECEVVGRVRTTTLESLASGFDRINLLKLDCEGSELDILEHAPDELLGRVDRVVGEFHDPRGAEHFEALLRRRFPGRAIEVARGVCLGLFSVGAPS